MRETDTFRRFSDLELGEVVRNCSCRKVMTGTELIRAGVEDDHIFVLAAWISQYIAISVAIYSK